MSWLSVLGPTVPWEATCKRRGATSTVVTRTVSGIGSAAVGSSRGAVAMRVAAANNDTTTTMAGIKTVFFMSRMPSGVPAPAPGRSPAGWFRDQAP